MTARHLTASMVVLDLAREAVLLVHHNATGKWVFPGGHVDPGEAPHEAALREVLEETGVRARIIAPETVYVADAVWHPSPWLTAEFDAPAKPHKGEPAHKHVDFLFCGTVASATADFRHPEREVSAVQWANILTLAQRDDVRAEVPNVAERALRYVMWARG